MAEIKNKLKASVNSKKLINRLGKSLERVMTKDINEIRPMEEPKGHLKIAPETKSVIDK